MRGIDRLVPNADTANKALEQKQNIYFLFVVKNSFSCHIFFVVKGCEVCTVKTSRKVGEECDSLQM